MWSESVCEGGLRLSRESLSRLVFPTRCDCTSGHTNHLSERKEKPKKKKMVLCRVESTIVTGGWAPKGVGMRKREESERKKRNGVSRSRNQTKKRSRNEMVEIALPQHPPFRSVGELGDQARSRKTR